MQVKGLKKVKGPIGKEVYRCELLSSNLSAIGKWLLILYELFVLSLPP